jgi:hypothetical protein
MTRIQDDQTTGRAQELVTELKAIELWDAVYKRNPFPLRYDDIAFVSRQKRRAEITSELQRMNYGNGYVSHTASGTGLLPEPIRRHGSSGNKAAAARKQS